ncbi:hypothetical protein IV102_08920 [bacterium]|nr:hypothetical protein [bacterium]
MRTFLESAWFLPVFGLMLLLHFELGYRLALRQKTSPLYRGRPIESAIIGLLSLLLGFTFNQAGQSYRERLLLVHEESDTVSQAYRVSELLPKAERKALRALLVEYLEAKSGDLGDREAVGLHGRIFAHVLDIHHQGLVSEQVGLALLQSVNRMISLHFRGVYSRQERVPIAVMALLVMGSWSISVMVGFASGVNERRSWVIPLVFFFLITCTLATIRDLDDPYGGWIRVDFSNLQDLLQILQRMRA